MNDTISRKRLMRLFLDLTGIDSETYYEKRLGERVAQELRDRGLEVFTDATSSEFLKAHPESHPNIYAVLHGDPEKEPVLLAAHLDTVRPGKSKRAQVLPDGTIRSAGNTVLGADDIGGVSAILEALSGVRESALPHPDVEILITAAEETFCEGSRYFDFTRIRSKKAYVFDLDGPVGTAANAAPSILSFEIEVNGRAAHAGFAPEKGVNALSIAVDALQKLPAGRVNENTTVNFGTITGGEGKNIVPERVEITGEVRSLIHKEAADKMKEIFRVFEESAEAYGGSVKVHGTKHLKAYRVPEDSAVVRHFKKAAQKAGLKTGTLRTTYGGSDANRLNENGIDTLVVASAMEDVHTTKEHTSIEELARAAVLAFALITE